MKIIDIEYTPNPNAVKFIVDEPLTVMGNNRTFTTVEEAEDVDLARGLFAIDGVVSVYFAGTWLTVTQDGSQDWRSMLRVLAEPIRAATGPRLGAAEPAPGVPIEDRPGMDDPRVALIQEILDEQIRPYLEFDGGGLEIQGLVDDQLFIRYHGACGTCPSSTTGTMMAIEGIIQREVDPNIEVITV